MKYLVLVMIGLVSVGGCATPGAATRGEVASASPATTGSRWLAGEWEGVVWETPSTLNQGLDRLKLSIDDDGRWRAMVGSRGQAAGVAIVADGRVALDGSFLDDRDPRTARGTLYYSLRHSVGRDGRDVLFGPAHTAFAGRTADATIELRKIR
jgi:hypothetical protein